MGLTAIFQRTLKTPEQVARKFDDLVVTTSGIEGFLAETAIPTGVARRGFYQGQLTGSLIDVRKGLEQISNSPVVPTEFQASAREGAQRVQQHIDDWDSMTPADARKLHENVSTLGAHIEVELDVQRPGDLFEHLLTPGSLLP